VAAFPGSNSFLHRAVDRPVSFRIPGALARCTGTGGAGRIAVPSNPTGSFRPTRAHSRQASVDRSLLWEFEFRRRCSADGTRWVCASACGPDSISLLRPTVVICARLFTAQHRATIADNGRNIDF
jgi:hypothetical protein